MIRSRFTGLGMAVPPNCIKNNDLQRYMDTSDDWIRQRSGIEQRYWVDEGVSTSDLGLEAANVALEQAKLKPADLDMILFATLSPDHEFPGTACFLQGKLGAPGIPAIDIRQQCSGFIYSVAVADQFIRTGAIRRALVVGAEVHSKGLDLTTRGRDVSVLFGDGAGAVVMEATSIQNPKTDSFLWSTHLHADGTHAQELWTAAPGTGLKTKERILQPHLEEAVHYPKMNGKSVFIHASQKMPESLQEALLANGLSSEEIDLYVLHQANLRINQKCAEVMGLPDEKVFNTIQKYGNTTAATIPIGLVEAEKASRLKQGTLVASAAFGSGYTWASMIYRW